MKYELIPKPVLDEAAENILLAINAFKRGDRDVTDHLEKAYKLLQENRTQCNVRPEGEKSVIFHG